MDVTRIYRSTRSPMVRLGERKSVVFKALFAILTVGATRFCFDCLHRYGSGTVGASFASIPLSHRSIRPKLQNRGSLIPGPADGPLLSPSFSAYGTQGSSGQKFPEKTTHYFASERRRGLGALYAMDTAKRDYVSRNSEEEGLPRKEIGAGRALGELPKEFSEPHHGWWDGGDMAESKREEWMDLLEDRFKAADLNGDGYLDVEELRSVLECTDQFCLSRHWLPIEQAALVLKKYDRDLTGKLTFTEFVDMADDHQLLMGVLDDYLEAFQALDNDGNGRIERGELRGVFEVMLGDDSETVNRIMDAVFKKGNLNGEEGTICFSEFLELVRSHTVDLQMVLDYMKLETEPERGPPAATRTGQEKVGDGMAQSLMGETEEPPEIISGDVVSVHSYSQLEAVLKAHPTVVLEVTFKWCRPCKMFAKKYKGIAESFPNTVFLKVVGDESEVTKAMLRRLNVKVSPYFIVWKDGQILAQSTGANENKVRNMVIKAESA